MKLIEYIKVKLGQLVALVSVSLGAFLYFNIPYAGTPFLIGIPLLVIFLLRLLKMSKSPAKGNYEIPEELANKTHIEVSTYIQDYKEESYMFYHPFSNKIYISKDAVEDYYDGNLRKKVVAMLKHEEGHASRRYRDQFNEISLVISPIIILGLIPNITDSVVLGTGLGGIVIIINILVLAFDTKRREKLADIYAIEHGCLEGIIQMYDVGELLLDFGGQGLGYPTTRERQKMIGEYLRNYD